jgi:hypothetical protein
LQDISAGGFSAVAILNLTHRAVYDVRFNLYPQIVVLRARLLGFEFVDTRWHQTGIAALIVEATITPV